MYNKIYSAFKKNTLHTLYNKIKIRTEIAMDFDNLMLVIVSQVFLHQLFFPAYKVRKKLEKVILQFL